MIYMEIYMAELFTFQINYVNILLNQLQIIYIYMKNKIHSHI